MGERGGRGGWSNCLRRRQGENGGRFPNSGLRVSDKVGDLKRRNRGRSSPRGLRGEAECLGLLQYGWVISHDRDI